MLLNGGGGSAFFMIEKTDRSSIIEGGNWSVLIYSYVILNVIRIHFLGCCTMNEDAHSEFAQHARLAIAADEG